METSEKIIGKNITSLREKRGYTSQQVANYLGISKSEFISIESGKNKINISELEKLSELFGIDAYDFYEKNINADHLIFAFKAKQISSDDLKSIACFMKIVRNYQRMKKEYETTSSTT